VSGKQEELEPKSEHVLYVAVRSANERECTLIGGRALVRGANGD